VQPAIYVSVTAGLAYAQPMTVSGTITSLGQNMLPGIPTGEGSVMVSHGASLYVFICDPFNPCPPAP
jgi:hypothetical protein